VALLETRVTFLGCILTAISSGAIGIGGVCLPDILKRLTLRALSHTMPHVASLWFSPA